MAGPHGSVDRAACRDPTALELENVREPIEVLVVVQYADTRVRSARGDQKVGQLDASMMERGFVCKRAERLLGSVGYGSRHGNSAKLCQIRRQPVEVVTAACRVQQFEVDDRTRHDLPAEERSRPRFSGASVAGARPR